VSGRRSGRASSPDLIELPADGRPPRQGTGTYVARARAAEPGQQRPRRTTARPPSAAGRLPCRRPMRVRVSSRPQLYVSASDLHVNNLYSKKTEATRKNWYDVSRASTSRVRPSYRGNLPPPSLDRVATSPPPSTTHRDPPPPSCRVPCLTSHPRTPSPAVAEPGLHCLGSHPRTPSPAVACQVFLVHPSLAAPLAIP
jgi:hypothetical protein